MKRFIVPTFAAAALTLSACANVTITKGGGDPVSASPNYEDSKSYFIGGLVGEHTVDVKKACDGGEAKQMQSRTTFLNGVVSILTLGIYTPRTARVWCEEKA